MLVDYFTNASDFNGIDTFDNSINALQYGYDSMGRLVDIGAALERAPEDLQRMVREAT